MSLPFTLSPAEEAGYLRTLPAIRERCSKVFELAQQGKLQHFNYHPDKEDAVAEYCISAMKRKYKPDFSDIYPHGRWRHLDTSLERISPLLSTWSANDTTESARRLVDLFIVSVLLDAGAGAQWKYTEEETGLVFSRSEGLGVASVRMFEKGLFSSDPKQPCRVDAKALQKLTPEQLAEHMQASSSNPLVGLEGRTSLLTNLGSALLQGHEFFGAEGRPGNLIDFLGPLTKQSSQRKIIMPLPALWGALMEGLGPIWPTRHTLAGVALGDVWPCDALRESLGKGATEGAQYVPFHKLTQWLTYSLLEIFTRVLGWEVVGGEDMTGLPEYRNGGLLIDLEVLSLKKDNPLPVHPTSGLPFVKPSHPAIVEWRAMTVILLDRIAALIRSKVGMTEQQLSLAQILEGATWNCGRDIAKEKREGGGPPIEIDSDGTVF